MEQSNYIEIKECPICGSEESKLFLESNDYSTSKEDFNVRECSSCSFRFTSPIPTEDRIGSYYESEDYISHTDSNKGMMNKVYQKVRTKAIKNKEYLIDTFNGEKTLLDIGCGTGDFLHFCKQHGWQTLGLEPDEGARGIANKIIPSNKQSFARFASSLLIAK